MNMSQSGTADIFLTSGTRLNNGQYRIIRVLGHGGFGITYLAEDTVLKQQVAIKEYFPHGIVQRQSGSRMVQPYSGERYEYYTFGLDRYIEEAQTLARFNGEPGIVSVHYFFRENETGYMVMEFLEGETVKDWLKSRGDRVGWDEALLVVSHVMDALKEMHRQGVIHRDISPDNIYLCTNGQVKLLDFGAARHSLGEHSKSLSVILKPGYAPFEQYTSKSRQGPWTDIYALAATLWRMTSGQILVESPDRMEIDAVPAMINSSDEIPAKYKPVLMKALSIAGKDRYQNIEAFHSALIAVEIAPAGVSGDMCEELEATGLLQDEATMAQGMISSASPPKAGKGAISKRQSVWVGMTLVFIVLTGAGIYIAGRGSDFDNSASETKDYSTPINNTDEYVEPVETERNIVDIHQATTGDIVQFGNYEQDNNDSNGKESIAWRVLAVENGQALLLAEKGLDCKKYNEIHIEVTWETCSLRSWLNNDFYKAAFSSSEQSQIALSTLNNQVLGGNDTQDKVFCLSVDEAQRYFPADQPTSDPWKPVNPAREMQPTAYAIAQGAWVCKDTEFVGNGNWWLRSPGLTRIAASDIDYNGGLFGFGTKVDGTHAVRPALWLNL